MISHLRLSSKFIIILITVFVVGASISWQQIKSLQYEKTQQELIFQSRLVLETMIAVRSYTSEDINHYLEPIQDTKANLNRFIKESAPSYAANKVFKILQRNTEYKDFEYKEAALNPTNIKDNLADSFESDLLFKFRSNPELTELSGTRTRNAKDYYFTARPISIKSVSCLVCHSTPESAPSSLLAAYGADHGFGWQLGEVVAIRMVYVPEDNVFIASYENAISIAVMLLPVLIALALTMVLLIRYMVVYPIQHLQTATLALGGREFNSENGVDEMKRLNKITQRSDEIGNLAKDFLLMASTVVQRESELDVKNKTLLKNKAYLQALLDNATDSIISIDEYSIIKSCNPATERVFGYSEHELLGMNINILLAEDFCNVEENFFSYYLITDENKNIGIDREIEGVKKDGSKFQMELSVSEMYIEDQRILTGFIRDITERENAMKLQHSVSLEKTRIEAESLAKSSFLANMSHEIRTPLAAIIGFAESILDSNSNIEQRLSAIHTIIRNGNYLLNIINEILDLSKIESSNFEIHIETMPVFDLLHDVQGLLENQALDKGLSFNMDYNFPLPTTIQSDKLRLKQILINLCSNAIKFTETGGVTLEVKFLNDCLYLSVIDTGKGLSKVEQENIFNEYVQADYLTYTTHGGTGLGLPISKKLTDKIGGALTLQSEINAGSRFIVCLPVKKAEATELVNELPAIMRESYEGTQSILVKQLVGHVLVAEDNADIASLIIYYLNNLGLQSTIVENGKEAVDAALQKDYDLILMDMQMPIMNGIQAVKEIKQSSCEIPIIMLTANAMPRDKEESMDAGCDDFLSKPLNREIFIQTLSKFLNTKDLTEDQQDALIIEPQDKGMDALIERFVEGLTDQVSELNNALSENNWGLLKSLFHQIKGLGGSFGFPQISELAHRTEFQIARQHKGEVQTAIMELENLHLKIVNHMNK